MGAWILGGARGVAMFVGGFLVVNGVVGLLRPGFDAGGWLVSTPLGIGLRVIAGAVLLAWGLAPRRTSRRPLAPWPSRAAWVLAMIALHDTVLAWSAFRGDEVDAGWPVPFSLCVLGVALALARVIRMQPLAERGPWLEHLAATATLLLAGAIFPALQFAAYGDTDYRRPADAIVVFGARTYANGRPSDALADRVRRAVEVFHQGHAPRLLFSGGPGDGAVHEVEAMRDLAHDLGVPYEAMVLDRSGVSTAATVRYAAAWGAESEVTRWIAVSHDFHLPRIRMAFQRAGLDAVATVPARPDQPLASTPYLWLRETAAFWVYWLRG